MKVLAIEKELTGITDSDYHPFLEEEARQAWKLQQQGLIRELYFTDDQCAVLMLEASDKAHAREIIDQLPLVREKLIDFDLFPLKAYSGFERLFKRI